MNWTDSGNMGMTVRRLILGLLTVLAIALMGTSLIQSWNQPQIENQLELYQTNLILHASEWAPDPDKTSHLPIVRQTLVGTDPIEAVFHSYQDSRQSVEKNLESLLPNPNERLSPSSQPPVSEAGIPTTKSIRRLKGLLNQFDLKIGILQTQLDDVDGAIGTWSNLTARLQSSTPMNADIDAIDSYTATLLTGMWSQPPRLLPDGEQWLNTHLEGWFRYKTLTRLYELQQRQDSLNTLQIEQQHLALQALQQLLAISALPICGCFMGGGLIIFLLIQKLLIGNRAIVSQNGNRPFPIPWDWEMIWQIGVGCFWCIGQVVVGQILVPVIFRLFQLQVDGNPRLQAFSILVYYVLVALSVILAIYWSVERYVPLPEGALPISLSGKWFWWGLGGYCTALPLVILVSFVNQKIWQGQGGSNPILPIALEDKDPIAVFIFFVTAAIAAPLFEEFLFRGLLLGSLTRYLSMGWAIALSGFMFALVHLNVSEVLPLTILGMVLGFVYSRSRNLLAPILLHGLWNGGTLVSLFILANGGG